MINTHNRENQKLTSKGNLLWELSQIVSQGEENGGEFLDEQNDDGYQNTEDIRAKLTLMQMITNLNQVP